MANDKKVLIIDDHPTFRESIKQVINRFDGFIVAGEASDAKQGEVIAQEIKPDVSVVDLSLPDKSGIQLTRSLKTLLPESQVVIVSMHAKIDYIQGALRAGALGYLVKESVAKHLLNALEAACSKKYYLDPALSHEIADKLIEIPQQESTENIAYGNLTSREQEILRLLAQGTTTKNIAEKLFISPKTVTNHRSNIMSKLDIHTSVELVHYATKLGLLDDFQ